MLSPWASGCDGGRDGDAVRGAAAQSCNRTVCRSPYLEAVLRPVERSMDDFLGCFDHLDECDAAVKEILQRQP
jgi:hypothetical protein